MIATMNPVFRFLSSAAACIATVALAHATTHIVTQSNFGFTPANITINVGDTVQWNWQNFSHTVTEGTDGVVNGNELFTFPLDPTHPTVTFTFTPAFVAAHPMPGGLYNYFCAVHFSFGMVGTITVNGPAATGTAYCAGDGSGTAGPCGNNSAAGSNAGCLNSLGSGAQLGASGTPSVSADTVVLTATGMPDSSVLYFQGTTQIAAGAGAAFGDGLRCAGGSVVRLGLKTNAGGTSSWPSGADPALSVKGGATASSTLDYQVWYRNAAAFCTTSTFNLSNGYAVTWTP
jgi:plastocyanin